jgi:hypothetical protein
MVTGYGEVLVFSYERNLVIDRYFEGFGSKRGKGIAQRAHKDIDLVSGK